MTDTLLDAKTLREAGTVPVRPVVEELATALRPIVDQPLITDEKMKEAEAVRVSIKRNENKQVIITCSHLPLPSLEMAAIHLAAEHKKKFRAKHYWSLENHIANEESGIPFQAWADAISSAIMQRLANEQGATSELKFATQTCYMSYGDTLFKMSPVAMIPQTKALATARKKIRDIAELEAKQLMDSVKVSANTMLLAAAKTKHDADAYKQKVEREIGRMPPKWLFEIGYPIRFDSFHYKWQIQITINFRMTHLDLNYMVGSTFKKFTWNALPMDPRKIRLWVPINDNDGAFQATAISVDRGDPRLPHINHTSGCMGLASGPKKITGVRDLENLVTALEFCHSRVQLDSLYTNIESLAKDWEKVIPPAIVKAMTEGAVEGVIRLAKKTIADAEKVALKLAEEALKRGEIETAQRKKETWTAETIKRNEETWTA